MELDEFRRALIAVYQENPCHVLPNPLWKTLAHLDQCETAVTRDSEGINRLEAYTPDSLLIYWRRSGRQPSLLINRRLEYQHYAAIHQDFLDAPTVAGFAAFESRYRFIHRPQKLPEAALPDGFRFAPVVDSPAEVEAVAAHIAQDDRQALDSVQGWLHSPAFASDLWLWVVDESTGEPAGLAVAELDSEYTEAALEWIQILPDYQGRGLGRCLVNEVLRRVGDRAMFTTVCGVVDDRDNPGAFFKGNGFSGTDVWWQLRR